MLFVNHVKLNLGKRSLLDDISFSLLESERVALVGQNGVGKSTFIRMLLGEVLPDSGKVEYKAGLRIGVLRQEPQFEETMTVLQLMQQVVKPHAEDEYQSDYRIEKVLSRLGVKARHEKLNELSGGERRRADLARLLLSEPDVYLLDEPTNHLDTAAISFLAEELKATTKPVLFVSHDRYFIDSVATKIVELEGGKLYSHPPSYQLFLENKLIRSDIHERSTHRKERLMAREIAWLRAGTPARTTKQKARIDRAEDLIEQVKVDVDAQRERIMRLEKAKAKRLAKTILELQDVGYKIGDRWLFRHLNFIVVEGERFGIVGHNGAGKTTLMKLMAGALEPTEGRVVQGTHTSYAFFDQNRSSLHPDDTLNTTLADHGDTVCIGEQRLHIASYLERFLFDGSDRFRQVSTLSGGEQNRLLLAKLFKTTANCLLLDEPTNDLDMTSLGVLEEALNAHHGVAFIVSHDKAFLDKVCTGIIAFEGDGAVVVYQGDYTTYERLRQKPIHTPKDEPAKVQITKENRSDKKRKRSYHEEREYAGIEAKIHEAEAEKAELQEQLEDGSLFVKDPQAAQNKVTRLHQVESDIERLFARWEELEALGG